MIHRFAVQYVGNDSRTHWKCVWADDASAARKKVSRSGIDFVLRVRPKPYPVVGLLILVAIIALIFACAYLGTWLSR